MAHSAQFEHEAERTRAHLADTMAELKSRLTVGQVADQLWDFARDSLGGDFGRNLARQVANNPLPVALVGTGVAWLMFANASPTSTRRRRGAEQIDRAPETGDGLGYADDDGAVTTNDGVRRTVRNVKQSVRRTTDDVLGAATAATGAIGEGYEAVTEGAGAMASSAYGAVKDGAEAVEATAASAYENIKERAASAQEAAASAYDKVKETAMQTREAAVESAQAAKDYAVGTAQRFSDFCMENPLVLIGAGVALGAIAGSLLPATEVEDELMGKTSDEVKQQAEHLAAEQVEKVERVGEKVVDQAAEAARQEFAGDSATDLGTTGDAAREARDMVGRVAP